MAFTLPKKPNIYKLLKVAGLRSVPASLKLLGLSCLLRTRRRMIGVFMDPALACNIRCRMCYFSDPNKRKSMKGIITAEAINKMSELLLPYALKLQIGCGAEPTLYHDLPTIIRKGKEAKVPYISLTTNGQLLGSGKVNLCELVDCGLNEITISLHGTHKETYENLMPGAEYEVFNSLVRQIAEINSKSHRLTVRVNFTVNSMNVEDLRDNRFFQLWDDTGCRPDIIQLRPVQNMGESDWQDFDLTPLKEKYDATIGNVVCKCKEKGIICIAPELSDLDTVDNCQGGITAMIEDITYCYVSPDTLYKADFNPDEDTFVSYHKRHHTIRRLLKSIIFGTKSRKRNASKKLNYSIK